MAAAAVAAFGFLAVGGGNRVGAVLVGADGDEVHPARSGRDHLRALLLALHRRGRASEGTVDLVGALEHLGRLARRRGLVVVVTDLLDDGAGPDRLRVALRGLSLRHDVVVVEVVDPREGALPAVGLVTLVDPETGRTLEVQTDDAGLRARFAAAAAARREELAATVRAAGCHHLVLSTDRDWVADVVHHVA